MVLELFLLTVLILYLYSVVKFWRGVVYGINKLRFYQHSKSDSTENYTNVELDQTTRKIRGKLTEFEGKQSLIDGEKSLLIGWYFQRKGEQLDGRVVWKTIGNGFHTEHSLSKHKT